jgi:hypothetical protein
MTIPQGGQMVAEWKWVWQEQSAGALGAEGQVGIDSNTCTGLA